jgi:hypothetical protein
MRPREGKDGGEGWEQPDSSDIESSANSEQTRQAARSAVGNMMFTEL